MVGTMAPPTTTQMQDLVERVRIFRDSQVTPHAASWERDRVMAVEALRGAAELGLLAMEVPTELGGLELTFRQKLEVIDCLTAVSMPFAFSLVNTSNITSRVALLGTDDHRRRDLADLASGRRFGSTALTEPGAGSDFGAIEMRGTPNGDGWRITGEKAWITNAALSDVIVTYVQTDPDLGAKGIASVLVDGTRPGFERVEPYELMGGHAIGTGGFRLDGYEASAGDVLAPPGKGFIVALSMINGARTYVASMCCSMIRASLITAVRYCSERRSFGRPLIEHQGLAWSLADVANKLEAARLLTDRAAQLIDEEGDRAALLPAAHAKKFATEIAEPCIAACVQAMGANGLREEYGIGQHLASARIANYVDGSTQIQTDRIARSLVTEFG